MSTPKTAKILNPRIKISKTGRPYIDVADLVKTRFERIEKSRNQGQKNPAPIQENRNGNTTTNDDSSNSRER